MTIDKRQLLILNETESAIQEWKLTLNYPSISVYRRKKFIPQNIASSA